MLDYTMLAQKLFSLNYKMGGQILCAQTTQDPFSHNYVIGPKETSLHNS